MTDSVNSSTPAALYALGGAVVGGGAGYASANYANFGVKTAYADNWEDAVRKVNEQDKFVSKFKNSSDNEVKGAIQKIEDHAPKIKSANEALETAINNIEDLKKVKGRELDLYLDAKIEAEDGPVKIVEDLLEKAKKKDSKIKVKEGENVVEKSIREYLGLDKDAETVEIADAKKVDYANQLKDTETFKEEMKKLNDAVDKAAEEVKDGDKAVEGLENKVTADVLNKKREYNRLAKQAEKDINPVLEKLKKPSTIITAAIGAVVLGALGYLLAPKSKDV